MGKKLEQSMLPPKNRRDMIMADFTNSQIRNLEIVTYQKNPQLEFSDINITRRLSINLGTPGRAYWVSMLDPRRAKRKPYALTDMDMLIRKLFQNDSVTITAETVELMWSNSFVHPVKTEYQQLEK